MNDEGAPDARPASEFGATVRLASPLALAFLGNQLLAAVDTAVVGRFSERALAAVGLGNGIYLTLGVVGLGVMLGLDPMMAQAAGAARHREARGLLVQAGWLALLLTVPLGAAMVAFTSILVPLGIEPALAAEANAYVYARLPGLYFFLLLIGARTYLQVYETTRPLVVGMVLANALNLPLDCLLVFGDGALEALDLPPVGLAPMGVIGAGLTTSVCTVLQAAVLLYAIGRSPHPRSRRPRPLVLREAVGIGLPVGLSILADIGALAIVGLVMGALGTALLAAYAVVTLWTAAASQLSLALAITAAVRVGKAVGRGDPAPARRAGLVALSAAAFTMVLIGGAFVLLRAPLVRAVTTEADVQALAVPMMVSASLYPLAEALKAVMAGALRGVRDTRFPLVANVVGQYALGLPVGLALTFGGLGASGLWWGLTTGLAAVTVVLFVRFLSRQRPREAHAIGASVA